MRNLNKTDSNRGGALLSVIVAMTVVGILGALVLSIAYTNFKMKQIDKKSKDNFYSAEAVLDEICVGLQQEISEQYEKAYTTVMENYGTYDSVAKMEEDFNTEFVLNMVEELQVSSAQSDYYDIVKIKEYVSANHKSSVSAIENSNLLDTLEYVNSDDPDEQDKKGGLCLRNLVITYADAGYVNKITTDIKITTPKVEFAQISKMPEIADYSMIAQKGIKQDSGYYKLQGKAFAGNPEGISIGNGSTLDANNEATTLLVTEGDVLLDGGAKFNTSAKTSLWANSITVEPQTRGGSIISLLGRTYIKDDTTLNGAGNTLELAGQYYGYSNHDSNASGSSAIIVNGSGTTLDMSKLETLALAGTSFIATNGVSLETEKRDVLMGDSVAVKGNQVAYLVPTECNGIITNPMTNEQYLALTQNGTDDTWMEQALITPISSLGGRSPASYGEVSIQPVASPKYGGIVYLYLGFKDADVASKYFMDYYGSSGEKIQSYIDKYVEVFDFNEDGMNRLTTQGNYLVKRENTSKAKYLGNTGDIANSAQEWLNYQSSYEALCTKLVENKSSLGSGEIGKTVYENLINEVKLKSFIRENAEGYSDNVGYVSNVATIWASKDEKSDSTKVRCIIVDNEDDDPYVVPNNGSGIIIATGDVTVNNGTPAAGKNEVVAWNGLIIAKGKVTLSHGSESYEIILKSDADAVSKAMQYVCTVGSENVAVMNFFKGGGDFALGQSSEKEDSQIDVRNCISFENWESE